MFIETNYTGENMKRIIILSFMLSLSFSFSQDCDTLTFNSHGSKLFGFFYPSNSPNSTTLLFTQGFMETGDIWGIGKFLSGRGVNVFMFDFRGCFQSKGKQGLMNSQQDIESALTFLSSEEITEKYKIDTVKFVMGGYSYGGHMSMLYAIYHPEIKSILSISGGDLGILAQLLKANPDLQKGYSDFFKSLKKPDGPIEFEYENPIDELLENQAYFSILDQTQKLLNTDILMTGGLDDQVVSMEDFLLPMYRKIKKNNYQKIRFLVYQTNHSYKNVSDKLIKDVLTWINNIN